MKAPRMSSPEARQENTAVVVVKESLGVSTHRNTEQRLVFGVDNGRR